MFSINSLSNHQPSAPSLETNITPTRPSAQGAMSHDSHLLISEAYHTITQSTSVLDKISVELQNFRVILTLLREETFEYVNEGTDAVTGKLKDRATAADHQTYVDKLSEFSAFKNSIQQLIDGNPFFNKSSLPDIHHSSYLYGDLEALNKGRSVPDFQYNSGAMQFG